MYHIFDVVFHWFFIDLGRFLDGFWKSCWHSKSIKIWYVQETREKKDFWFSPRPALRDFMRRCKPDFTFTSIQIVQDYASRLHVDGNNLCRASSWATANSLWRSWATANALWLHSAMQGWKMVNGQGAEILREQQSHNGGRPSAWNNTPSLWQRRQTETEKATETEKERD